MTFLIYNWLSLLAMVSSRINLQRNCISYHIVEFYISVLRICRLIIWVFTVVSLAFLSNFFCCLVETAISVGYQKLTWTWGKSDFHRLQFVLWCNFKVIFTVITIWAVCNSVSSLFIHYQIYYAISNTKVLILHSGRFKL